MGSLETTSLTRYESMKEQKGGEVGGLLLIKCRTGEQEVCTVLPHALLVIRVPLFCYCQTYRLLLLYLSLPPIKCVESLMDIAYRGTWSNI
jgi:hypothetical protein